MPDKSPGKSWVDQTASRNPKISVPPKMFEYSKLKAETLYRRVWEACPGWDTWPTELKQVFVLLPICGSIESICSQLGLKPEKIEKQIEQSQTFQTSLKEYLRFGDYPKIKSNRSKPGTEKRLRHADLEAVFTMEMAVLAGVKLSINGTAAHMTSLLKQSGTLERVPGPGAYDDEDEDDAPTSTSKARPLQTFDRKSVA